MKWYRKLHWQIILGMILGLIYGIAAAQFQWTGFATNWVVPFGDIFMNLLKLIAVPLVLTSLVAGVASLSDFKKLSRMGSKTIGLYIATTAVAVTIGLLVVNTLQPGSQAPRRNQGQARGTIPSQRRRQGQRRQHRGRPPTRPAAAAGGHGAGQLFRLGIEQPKHAATRLRFIAHRHFVGASEQRASKAGALAVRGHAGGGHQAGEHDHAHGADRRLRAHHKNHHQPGRRRRRPSRPWARSGRYSGRSATIASRWSSGCCCTSPSFTLGCLSY